MAARQITTVRGAVTVDDSNVQWVLSHEHLFHSIYARVTTSSASSAERAPPGPEPNGTARIPNASDITLDQLHKLRMDPTVLDGRNLIMEREDEIFREVEALVLHASGTGVIIDVSTATEGRDLGKLRRLADRVGVHIVASTSFDQREVIHMVSSMSSQDKSERIAKTMETELMFGVGVGQSEGSAGVIYQQVHLCAPTMQSQTDDILAKGLALAQKNTGAPIFLSFSHDASIWSSEEARISTTTDWINSLIGHGACPDQVIVCHADLCCESIRGIDFLVQLARRGIVLSFNLIGLYTVSDVVIINPCLTSLDPKNASEPPRDSTIAKCVATLIHDHGLGERILISSGVQQRTQLLRYGGGGYAYVLEHFKLRLMHQHAVTLTEWEQISSTTALKLLSWYSPPAAAEIPKHFLKCTICAEYFEPIVGEYFSKFEFVYCGTKCLRRHSKLGFKPHEK